VDSRSEYRDIEVEQEAHGQLRQAQIGQDLRKVNWVDSIHALYFDDQYVFHQQVEAIAAIQGLPTIPDGKRNLALDVKAAISEFPGEACFVGGFQESGSECSVNRNRPTDNLGRESIEILGALFASAVNHATTMP
jgi:hypothetical protein